LRHDRVELLALGGVGDVDAVVVDEQRRLVHPGLATLGAGVLLDGLAALAGQRRGRQGGGLLGAAGAGDLVGRGRGHRSRWGPSAGQLRTLYRLLSRPNTAAGTAPAAPP